MRDIIQHYGDVIMGEIASQITSLAIVYSTVYSDADQRKHQSSASLAFVRGIHRGPVNSPHKWPVITRKMFPFDDVIMGYQWKYLLVAHDFVVRHFFALNTLQHNSILHTTRVIVGQMCCFYNHISFNFVLFYVLYPGLEPEFAKTRNYFPTAFGWFATYLVLQTCDAWQSGQCHTYFRSRGFPWIPSEITETNLPIWDSSSFSRGDIF